MLKYLNKKPLVGVFAVFLVALFFRFFMLTRYPVSFSMDEVAIGVNAYDILKTGHDEHGKNFPLAFESVGDYKPPVNIYLTTASEAIFGLSEFAVRAPVALLGALSAVIFIFLLRKFSLSWTASIFGGFWLSIVPWHVHFSRGSFEAITALMFLVLGTYFFIRWLGKKSALILVLSVISFSISVWAYHAERFFVPFLVIFLVLLYRKEVRFKLLKVQKQIFLGVITLALFAVPFINLAFFTPAVAKRAAVTSILREPSLAQSLHASYSSLTQSVLDNNGILIFRHWAGKYLNYFDPRFIFWKGMQFTPPGFPGIGILYAADLPLFLFGIYSLAKSDNKKLKAITLFWFFAGPLSASFTMNEQHPLRALTWLPFFGIVIAFGAEGAINSFKKIKFIAPTYFLLLVFNIIYFGDIYMNQFPRFYAESWQYGYKQVAEYSCSHVTDYDKILISDTFGKEGPIFTGTPYLYELFYCPANMENFLSTGEQLSKFEYRRPNRESIMEKGKLLLIGSQWDFLEGDYYGGKLVNKIDYPSGEPAFLFIEKQ